VTRVEERPLATPAPAHRPPTGLLRWLTTTDHKLIGISYMVTALVAFLVAGLFAVLVRVELAEPGRQLLSTERFNQLFTLHGSLMLFVFAVPFFFGLANYLVPLQIGAPDMSFPRLNALSYWLYLGGGLLMVAGLATSGGAADFGWFAYVPLSDAVHAPGVGADLWILSIILTGTSGILTAVNLVTTVVMLRAPGMTFFRMPVFTWDMLVTSVLVLLAFPVLTAALAMLFAERRLDAHVFDAAAGGAPILWQHLFWWFGHPEVYIAILPAFGVVTEIFPVFSRKPIFGYRGLILATLAIAGLSMGVWAHHMFVTGAVLLPFFSLMTFLIAVPTGVKFFNWIGTMWRGSLTFESPMLFALGFLFMFLVGGLTGPVLASPPLDFALSDTYFVVAHMHYVLFGGSMLAGFAALYYWFPKFTGRRLSEGLSRWHFWLTMVGMNLAFFPMHLSGVRGMPRRVADYAPDAGLTFLNRISTSGALLLALSAVPFLWNFVSSWRRGPAAGDDPWGGHTLEWATSSPPPEFNFTSLPPVRSERPLFDLNHPAAAREAGPGAGT
jgi:cytochrome c oxidase subunit 1